MAGSSYVKVIVGYFFQKAKYKHGLDIMQLTIINSLVYNVTVCVYQCFNPMRLASEVPTYSDYRYLPLFNIITSVLNIHITRFFGMLFCKSSVEH